MDTTRLSSPPAVLKGAPGHIYQLLQRLIREGCDEISYLTLSLESGYAVQTVATAVQMLARHGLIAIEQRGPGRAHRYRLH